MTDPNILTSCITSSGTVFRKGLSNCSMCLQVNRVADILTKAFDERQVCILQGQVGDNAEHLPR
jgi:hypothetical protein